jgi:hypothetical protein
MNARISDRVGHRVCVDVCVGVVIVLAGMTNRRRRLAQHRRLIANLQRRLGPSPWGLRATFSTIKEWFHVRDRLRQLGA